MLEVRHLTKVYDDGCVALKDVSFQVPDGGGRNHLGWR
jgi:ABC-type Na+ transport system ATPase subunit NatA